jgi:AraC family transcriptional regulator, regulatory protein of adaptative response / methylated-DNA-[protein]-cysteine methyltransferase
MIRTLPPKHEMHRAFMAREASYDGLFVAAVRTTGIFCRASCPARKPDPENVEFLATPREALARGFRPCKRCRPMERPGETPPPIRRLLAEMDDDPGIRIRDVDLSARGLDPVAVRRWFRKHHGLTFQEYQRARRVGRAIRELGSGTTITEAAFGSGYESLSGFQEAVRQLTGRSPARSRDADLVYLTRVLTPLGPMVLGATDRSVVLLEFSGPDLLEGQIGKLGHRLRWAFAPGTTDPGRHLEAELEAYFAGTLREFRAPIQLPGTRFQERAWAALRQIPYGATRSYSEQAVMVGSPSAVRAVARANGANRIAIVVPCHRVIGADGTLTGYGAGVWRKRWLLDHEKAGLAVSERPRTPASHPSA